MGKKLEKKAPSDGAFRAYKRKVVKPPLKVILFYLFFPLSRFFQDHDAYRALCMYFKFLLNQAEFVYRLGSLR